MTHIKRQILLISSTQWLWI